MYTLEITTSLIKKKAYGVNSHFSFLYMSFLILKILQKLTHRSDKFVRNGKLVVDPSNRFDCGQNVVSRSSREYSFSSVQYKSYNYNGHQTNENSMLVL